MEIRGPIPFQVAQAYGVRPPAMSGVSARAEISSSLNISAHRGPEPGSMQRSPLIDRIVAATVHRPMDFDGAATVSPHASLQLYTRAADKIEAAVAVNVGRAIDVVA